MRSANRRAAGAAPLPSTGWKRGRLRSAATIDAAIMSGVDVVYLAPLIAAMRADALLAMSDAEGQRVWKGVHLQEQVRRTAFERAAFPRDAHRLAHRQCLLKRCSITPSGTRTKWATPVNWFHKISVTPLFLCSSLGSAVLLPTTSVTSPATLGESYWQGVRVPMRAGRGRQRQLMFLADCREMRWLKNVEPTIDDILSDPIVLLVIGTHSSPESVRTLLESVARSRCPVAPSSTAPQSDPAC